MIYSLLAKLVALTHFAFIMFVIAGGLLVLRWPRLAWIHVPAAVWGVLIEFAGWYCPLTTWENTLLRRAGQAGYSNGFIEHYLFALIYPEGLTRSMQVAIGVVVIVVNVAIYARLAQRS
ncbi:MAG TPA: DUF2784 domain-containing protein [Thermoanaerobaculia bacterium]|nr:DUF2784 domain-containing protein [Thermoanaerobaculia bacterium]